MPDKTYYIGLISGTSIDAVDCALVSFSDKGALLEATHSHKYDPALRNNIFNLCEQREVPLELLGETDIAVALSFSAAVQQLLANHNLKASQITAIGSHGQTVYHKPRKPLPFTLQIGDPNTLALHTGITTVADFRRKDMAAGGQGAPLAPLFHRYCFSSPEHQRVIVNLGGIANISILAAGLDYLGYDTGPANVLMDYWINKNQQFAFDENGEWAASGNLHTQLLELLLEEPYFSEAEPKSTGREYFNGAWLEERLSMLEQQPQPADVQATLLELTAATVVTEIENQLCPDQVFLCGGGAHNGALISRIAELLPDSEVTTTAHLGLEPDWVEAMTFAWLAKQRMEATTIDTCSVTGAQRPVVLGGIYLAE